MAEPRKLQKDDLPQELWPVWDELQEVARQMEAAHRHLHRARNASWLATGALLTGVVANVAVIVLRAL